MRRLFSAGGFFALRLSRSKAAKLFFSSRNGGKTLQKITIACKGTQTAKWKELQDFQGDLKKLPKDAEEKLKARIIEQGFFAPFFFWRKNGQAYLIDGHQRKRALQALEAEGYEVPEELPAVEIIAKDETEAKRKLLSAVSAFGEIDQGGLFDFLQSIDMDFNDLEADFAIPDFVPPRLEDPIPEELKFQEAGREMKSPIRYFGGKNQLAPRIVQLIPPHQTYVEPFAGGASVFFAKKPSPVEILNDADSDVVNFYRVLRDEKKFKRFFKLVSLTPFSREEFYFARENLEKTEDDVEKARLWFVLARQSFGGGQESFATSLKRNQAKEFFNTVEKLPEIHERIKNAHIENYDFRKILEIYDDAQTFFYLDPPYVSETRRSGEYKHEMTLEDHQDLVQILLKIKGQAVLSGYDHPVYEPLEKSGWKKIAIEVSCYAAGRTKKSGLQGKGKAKKHQKRVEILWVKTHKTKRKGEN